MSRFRLPIYALIGVAFGGLLVWLLLRQIPSGDVRRTLASLDLRFILAAMFLYAVAIALRSWRWSILLSSGGRVRYAKVLLVLIIGYAVNNLLPARLGELVRASLAKSRLQVSGSFSLGTIAIERTIDGLIVVGLLAVGFLALPGNAPYHKSILSVLIGAAALFGFAALFFFFLSGRRRGLSGRLWTAIADKIGNFQDGLAALRSSVLLAALAASCVVWVADCTSQWFLLRAVGITLTPVQLALSASIVSLSMLLPTAPGFVGTLQLAFVIAVTSFGYSSAQGFAAAVAWQVYVIGTATLLGIVLMIVTHANVVGLIRRSRLVDTGQ